MYNRTSALDDAGANLLFQDIRLKEPTNPTLVTVFSLSGNNIANLTESRMQQWIDDYQSTDDVFQAPFLQGIIFTDAEGDDSMVTKNVQALLVKKGMQWFRCLPLPPKGPKIQPGPYILLEGRLREVWRLYSDRSGAFFSTLRPGSKRLVQIVEFELNSNDF